MLEVQHVSHEYTVADGRLPTLKDVSFSIGGGEIVSIVGPSGCGKTTLLRIIAGLLEPTSGKIRIEGQPVHEARRRNSFSVVFQDPVLLRWRTAIENVLLPVQLVRGAIDKEERARAEMLLGRVGLDSFIQSHPSGLSGGMKHRVALARALILEPKLLLMDEPFADVDQFTRWKLNDELFQNQQKSKASILFITHDISEAVYLSDRIVTLTTRPAEVSNVIVVPAKQPRSQHYRMEAEFFEIVATVMSVFERNRAT